METTPAIRKFQRKARPSARCSSRTAQPVKERPAGFRPDGFLNHSFKPFSAVGNRNYRETEREFFRSAKNLCELYQFGKYQINAYLEKHPELVLGDEVTEGTNAYGDPTLTVWHNGLMEGIAGELKKQVAVGLQSNFNYAKWQAISFEQQKAVGKQFTFLPVPEEKGESVVGQLGLFDTVPVANSNKANAYLSDLDKAAIDAHTARVISTIRTTVKPVHDSIVLLTARAKTNGRYVYKLYSNVAEISVPNKWANGQALGQELDILAGKLKYFAHDYRYEGDTSLQPAFKLTCERQISIIEGKLVELSSKSSGIGPLLDKALKNMTNLPEIYQNADNQCKRQIISSMYPENLTFDGEQHRTTRVNEAIRVFDSVRAVFEAKNKGKSTVKVNLPSQVAGSRIELPTLGL